MFKPQQKHKARHGGYKQKPSKQSVNATLLMYMGCHEAVKQIGQLKLDL
jgi:hypothetical protein